MKPKFLTLIISCSVALILTIVPAGLSARGDFQKSVDSNQELVRSSRQAIIATGFSDTYFDQHFKVVGAYDKPGDRRVVWRFSLNGYDTLITDAIGFFNDAARKRTYVHSVANTLGVTRNIAKTISRQRAESLMRACVGRFTNQSAVFMSVNPREPAGLFLMAYAASKTDRREDERKGERRNDNDNRKNATGVDEIPREGGEDERPIVIGYINLETGKCSKGEATVTP